MESVIIRKNLRTVNSLKMAKRLNTMKSIEFNRNNLKTINSAKQEFNRIINLSMELGARLYDGRLHALFEKERVRRVASVDECLAIDAAWDQVDLKILPKLLSYKIQRES